MRLVVFSVVFLLAFSSFVVALNDKDEGILVGADVEPLTESGGCVDTDAGEDVYDAGLVIQWDDVSQRADGWLFNWDSCVYPAYEYIEEATCVDGHVKRVTVKCPEGTVCTPFTHFESSVFESFIATWISLMVAEGMTPEEVAAEIEYIRDEWQKAGACLPVEGEPETPIIRIPGFSIVDILHGTRFNTGSIPFFPRDNFDGARTRVTVEGEENSRIVKVNHGVLSVSEDDGSSVENTIRVKKKAAERLSDAGTTEGITQEFATSFKKGDVTFTGRSLQVKAMGFAHKIYGLFH